MAVTGSPGPEDVLPCGRPIEPLWEQVVRDRGIVPDEHQASCPWCGAAMSGFAALAQAVFVEQTDQSLIAPPSLRARIMAAVRSEVGPGRRLAVERTPLGRTDLAERAATVVLRHAAATVPGVRVRRCRVLDTEPAGAGHRVELGIGVPFGVLLPDLLEAVRRRVATVAAAVLGLPVEAIDIAVEDVHRG